MAFGNNEFSQNHSPRNDRDERNRDRRYDTSEREDRSYDRPRHNDGGRNENYSNFSRNRENDSRKFENDSGYQRNNRRDDEEMFSSRETGRNGYNRSDTREDTNGFSKSNGYQEKSRQNHQRDEFDERSGHNRQNNYRNDHHDENRRYPNDNSGRMQDDRGFRQERRGQNDSQREDYQDRRGGQNGGFQNQNRGYQNQNDGYQEGRRNGYQNDRNNYQDRNGGQNGGFQRRNNDGGYGQDDRGFQRRDGGREDRGFQRRDDNREDRGFQRRDDNQYQGRNQGRDQGYQNNDSDRFSNGGRQFNNGGGFEARGFGNNGRGFNGGGGGYSRNDDRFGGGGGGGYERGGNDYNSGYGGGMEQQKERAPKEWMPDYDDTEELMRKTQENVQNLDIHEDRTLEIRNSDFNTQLTSWENSGLHSQILANIAKLNYHNVRPVQAAVIPQIMRGYDVCGQAETSGGKTAAFGLPVIHKILEYPAAERESVGQSSAPYALILAPTRELAKQIYENLKMYANGTDVQVQLTYGEMNRWDCLSRIQKGCHILVGTCGRIMDYLQKGEITCKNLKFFILDEADRLLDDLQRGSGTHLSSIVNDKYFVESKDDRQTLLFSATFNRQVEIVARDFMKRLPGQEDVVRIVISQGRVNKRVNLHFIQANNVAEKNDELFKLLSQTKDNGRVLRTLVFVEQKQRTDYVAIELKKGGVNAASINGDRPQHLREQTLANFKRGEIDVLVGTDVCSRGLDIADLDRVINFDVPKGTVESATDTFIHRVGRTGRMKEGHAYTLVNTTETNDLNLIPSFIDLLKSMDREDTVPGWMRNVGGGGSYGGNRGFGGYEASKPSGFQASSSTGYSNTTPAGTSNGFGSSSFGNSGFGNTPMPKKKEESANDEEKKGNEEEEDDDW